MILPNQKSPHARRVTTPDGAYVLETLFQPERGETGLRLLDRQQLPILSVPVSAWDGPVDFTGGRFTFSLVYNGRRTAVRLDPDRHTFVFQPTDAPEAFDRLPDRLAKMFGKPRSMRAPRTDLAPPADWTQSPPRGAVILHSALGLFNFLMGAALIYLPFRLGWTVPAVISLAGHKLEPHGMASGHSPLPLLLAAVVLLTGLLAQLLALPRLFPQLASAATR